MDEPRSSVQTTSPDRSVTVVVRRLVKPDRQQQFEEWAKGVIAEAGRFPGHMGATLLTPALTGGPENLLVFRFDTEPHLAAWNQSAAKTEWLGKIADSVVGDAEARSATGLEYWFHLPGVRVSGAPPRVRMAFATFLGIVPLTLAAALYLPAPLLELPVPLRVGIVSAIIVILMTYVVMPLVTRMLKRWLFPATR
ncbi:MAG TPA: antibiotic biosynthesis monooxygenase [Vicinamibacterales bacterium]|jgi:hypothetical protein|nr:antibiotic biosynthesis monooxygenase [Vicinamibacterales bacterium]